MDLEIPLPHTHHNTARQAEQTALMLQSERLVKYQELIDGIVQPADCVGCRTNRWDTLGFVEIDDVKGPE